MKLSIVTTLYKSALYIDEFCARAIAAANQLVENDYEIILVNDGSPDDSVLVALKQRNANSKIKIVDLSRNFGHHKAMMTGLAHAGGDLVFLIDCDLEESPEWLLDFATQMNTDNCDVVYGVQRQRKGKAFERWSGGLFYSLFNAATGIGLTKNVIVVRLMTRRYVQALLLHKEREVFLAGLWLITGFDQRPKLVDKLSRPATTYTLRGKISLLVNSVTSFSHKPLVWIFYVGTGISCVALTWTTLLAIQWLFLARPPTGYTSLMASVWLLGGMIICFIGIIGIYLSKIFSETKQRPYTIVKKLYGDLDERDSNHD